MKVNDFKLLHKAISILYNEGFRGIYGGEEANIFFDAYGAIEKALEVAKKPSEKEVKKEQNDINPP